MVGEESSSFFQRSDKAGITTSNQAVAIYRRDEVVDKSGVKINLLKDEFSQQVFQEFWNWELGFKNESSKPIGGLLGQVQFKTDLQVTLNTKMKKSITFISAQVQKL
ncbi:30007_t:CDS:2 [Gigaspora margarita]|uniref:30007_t:CDS:1 n=1 Tax=Gigaspora margarita TaxID=4874 RepID=A0ABN7V411_GIGMA|nr:30007_t:CDS:2 [Gigaspora margarita]